MSNWNLGNLRLLATFDAIMTRGSVGSAADAMNVTQSAVSKQLAQLRDWLGDDLFVRTSEGMSPTPRALAIRERVGSILDQAESLVTESTPTPSEFSGRFVLSGTDQLLHRLAPVLIERLAREAPRLQLAMLPLERDYHTRQLESGAVNLVIAINWRAPELLKQKLLGHDRFVCAMHRDHPLAGSRLTLKRYLSADHILVSPLGSEKGVVDIELDRRGLTRNVVASVPAFSMINAELLGKSRIVAVPTQVAKALEVSDELVVKEIPLPLPVSDYYALWHPRFSAEPRFRYLLTLIEEVFAG